MKLSKKINGWLSGYSEFYSELAGELVTRRQVLIVNTIAACIIIAAIAASGALIVSAGATACAGMLVRKLNKE